MRRIVFPESIFNKVRKHLLKDKREQFGFLLAGVCKGENLTLLVREFIPAQDNDLEIQSPGLVRSKKAFVKRILRYCYDEGFSLIDVHSHPFSSNQVNFSGIDDRSERESFRYTMSKIPHIHHASMVFGENSFRARIWDKREETMKNVEEVKVIGSYIKVFPFERERLSFEEDRFSRQILAFGEEGQRRLKRTQVAVVGVGGIGSLICQMLSRLGVGKILLVDMDVVERSNLNRLVGSFEEDIGKPKVKVLERWIRNLGIDVESVPYSVQEKKVWEKIKEVDVIFGCTDNQVSRFILNELSVKYFIPYIDLGVGIESEGGKIKTAGGQVKMVLPDGPCLFCMDGINLTLLNQELKSEEEREMDIRAGYISGEDIPDPAVISLNSTIASLGVNEFLNLLCGFKETEFYLYYDLIKSSVKPIKVRRNHECVTCGERALWGKGDLVSFPLEMVYEREEEKMDIQVISEELRTQGFNVRGSKKYNWLEIDLYLGTCWSKDKSKVLVKFENGGMAVFISEEVELKEGMEELKEIADDEPFLPGWRRLNIDFQNEDLIPNLIMLQGILANPRFLLSLKRSEDG
ncbi:ThiF family adenylyltransferase [Candidatus Calescamantes bacterium]|nr:ThiF family adenylyltransferase [Candidatus Calescamantes bacterium]